jgi:hypothetical protein
MIEGLGWILAVVAVLTTLVLMHDRGYATGVRSAWFVFSLLPPAWLIVTFRSIHIEPIAALAVTALVWGLLRPFQGFRFRWVGSDLLLVALLLSCFVSDVITRTMAPASIIEMVRIWLLPYVLGRLLFSNETDYRQPLNIISLLVIGLCLLAVFEAVFKLNIFTATMGLSGAHWELLDQAEEYRWGLKRAQVTRSHPIYFGMLIVLTLPWLLLAAREARRGFGPSWWKLAPLAGIVAALVSMSRSAQISLLVVLGSDLFFRRPVWRVPLLIALAFMALFVAVYWIDVLDLLGQAAGEEPLGTNHVFIQGIQYEYSGSLHRELLVLVYQEAADQAGWFGYGSNLYGMPVDPNMDPRFASIDQHYLLHYLRYGSVGVLLFGLFVVAAAWNFLYVGLFGRGVEAELAGGFFGTIIAVALVLRGVWLPEDFGATWLFVAGIGASMRARLLLRVVPTTNAVETRPALL